MAVGLNWSFKKGTCFSILNFYFIGLRFEFKFVGGGPTRQSLFFACAKKSNQKKAHNLTKIDPDITYVALGLSHPVHLNIAYENVFHST